MKINHAHQLQNILIRNYKMTKLRLQYQIIMIINKLLKKEIVLFKWKHNIKDLQRKIMTLILALF